MVGIIQYFKHDLFNSVARTFYLRKSYIAHEHYGRHSAVKKNTRNLFCNRVTTNVCGLVFMCT